MAGEKSPCSDFSQSTEEAKRCKPSKRQRVGCCSFLPALGHLPAQKVRLHWCWRCNGSRRSNTGYCRGCCSGQWDLGCTLFAGMQFCTVFTAGTSWIKAGVGVFPSTTTLPSHCSADTHTHAYTHTHTYIGVARIHPLLPSPPLRCCKQRSLLLLTALHTEAEGRTLTASYSQADLTMQE